LAATSGDSGNLLSDTLHLAMIPRRATDTDEYDISLGVWSRCVYSCLLSCVRCELLFHTGWRVDKATATRLKSGSGDGFEGNMLFNQAHGIALVVLSNSYIDEPPDIDTTSMYIFAQLMKMYPELIS
jgi:hypothetical protein